VFSSQQVITTDADRALSVCAADLDGDGDQDVLSASYGDDKIAWYENLSQQTVHYVIAAMGDSYASGQGNPATNETPMALATWLTDGISTDSMFPNLTIRTEGDNAASYRSPHAASVQLARMLAAERQGSAVELIFAPQNGATMAESAEVQVAQISDLMKELKGSQVDVLTLSFGGNDIGFYRIGVTMACASLLSEASRVSVKEALKIAVETGTGWNSVREMLKEAEGGGRLRKL
jgi:hypothetical protein